MQTYELSYIVSPEVTSVEAEAKAKELEMVIQQLEGVILKQITPVAKTLSFQIKKHASGFFGVVVFQLEQEKLQEFVTVIQKEKKIVRHMVLVKKPVKIKKQRRSNRDSLPTEELPTIEATKPSLLEKLGFGKKEEKVEETPEPVVEKVQEKKIDLEDIDKQLDEILGE